MRPGYDILHRSSVFKLKCYARNCQLPLFPQLDKNIMSSFPEYTCRDLGFKKEKGNKKGQEKKFADLRSRSVPISLNR